MSLTFYLLRIVSWSPLTELLAVKMFAVSTVSGDATVQSLQHIFVSIHQKHVNLLSVYWKVNT